MQRRVPPFVTRSDQQRAAPVGCQIRRGPGWTERRAGIGFTMSTQRRASRTVSAIDTDRERFWRVTAPLMSIIWLAWDWLTTPTTRNCRRGLGLTTPATKSCRRGPGLGVCDESSQAPVTERTATNSLLSDRLNDILASRGNGSGAAPPGRTRSIFSSSLRVSHWSSLRYVPILPVRAHLHTTLPFAPAGEVRWAERHDGKRDLYFQHAA